MIHPIESVQELRVAAERARAGQFTAHAKWERASKRSRFVMDETDYKLGLVRAELDLLIGAVLDFCRTADQLPLPLGDANLQQ